MSRRLDAGGSWIDRSKPLTFRFGDEEYEGFEGDTLASALLANGVVGGFMSPILGRPRGVMTAGPEEPNAFVEVSEPWFDPIVAATTVELVDGLVADPRAGVGRLPDPAKVSSVEAVHRHVHVETLVVGGGPAGRKAAVAAASRGDRVILMDERHRIGYVVAHERSTALERLWHVRAARVVLETGAHERFIAFAGNDRPGVMLASAAATYAERFAVLPGDRAAIFTTNDAGLRSADQLRTGGADIVRTLGVGEDVSAALDEAVLLLVSGGWNPNLTLWRSIGGGLRYDERLTSFRPNGDAPPWL